MKKEKSKLLGSVFISLFIITLCTLFLAESGHLKSSSPTFDQLSNNLTANKQLIYIDLNRRTSVKKIKTIISRYNKSMPESNKSAIAHEIYIMSEKYPHLNVDFVCATITHESARTWDPKVVSKVGAMGLMQIMPTTGAFLAAEEGMDWSNPEDVLSDPIKNIRLGCKYLNNLVGMYEQEGGLAAYNGGPQRAEMWLAANRNYDILYRETRNYIPAVLKLYNQFRSESIL